MNPLLIGFTFEGTVIASKADFCFVQVDGVGQVFAGEKTCQNWHASKKGARVSLVLQENTRKGPKTTSYSTNHWRFLDLPQPPSVVQVKSEPETQSSPPSSKALSYVFTGQPQLGRIKWFSLEKKFGRIEPVDQKATVYVNPRFFSYVNCQAGPGDAPIRPSFDTLQRETEQLTPTLYRDRLVVFLAEPAEKGPAAYRWDIFEHYVGANLETEIVIEEGEGDSARKEVWRGTLRELIDQHPLKENGPSAFQGQHQGQYFVFMARCPEFGEKFYRIPEDYDPRLLVCEHRRRENKFAKEAARLEAMQTEVREFRERHFGLGGFGQFADSAAQRLPTGNHYADMGLLEEAPVHPLGPDNIPKQPSPTQKVGNLWKILRILFPSWLFPK